MAEKTEGAAPPPPPGNGTEHLPVVSKFSIRFNDGDGLVLHGGELLKGSILVELNEKTTLQAVKVQIKGRATWLGDGQAKAEYEKVYFNQDMTLLERPPGRPEPGHFPWNANYLYTLPFECPIPKGCPTSYESPFGSIRYYVKATLIEEDEHGQRGVTKEHYVKKAFMLLSPWDRLPPLNGEPVTVSDADFYGKCCCKGKLAADLSLSKSVFYPGEDVYGSIKLNGKKPKNIMDQIEVRLVDRVLRVGTPEKMGASPYRTLVATRLDRTDKSKGGDTIDGVYFLTIPSCPPSTKGHFDEETGELAEMAPNGLAAKQFPGILESPSTATLRFRRQPFLRIQYAIQVSIGDIVILDAPITVAELSHTGGGDSPLRSFVVGSQPIEEASDSGKSAFGGPFAYTPLYPVRMGSQMEVKEKTGITEITEMSNGAVSEMTAPLTSSAISSASYVSPPSKEEQREEGGGEERETAHSPSLSPVSVHAEEEREQTESTPVSPVQVTVEQPVTKTEVHTDERVEEVRNEEGEVVGTITTKTTTTESSTTQVVEMSGEGEEAVREVGERLADGWGEEGTEGVERVEQSSSVVHGEDGEVIATTTTTKILKRVKREVREDGEEEEDEKEATEDKEEKKKGEVEE